MRRIIGHAAALGAFYALAASPSTLAQQTPPNEAPPQVDPEVLHKALGLSTKEILAIDDSGCATVEFQSEGAKIFRRISGRMTENCVNGLMDGRFIYAVDRQAYMGNFQNFLYKEKANQQKVITDYNFRRNRVVLGLDANDLDALGNGLREEGAFQIKINGEGLLVITKMIMKCGELMKSIGGG